MLELIKWTTQKKGWNELLNEAAKKTNPSLSLTQAQHHEESDTYIFKETTSQKIFLMSQS